MSEVKVNKISPRSGTNVQLGDSGDTITVPSGATLDASNATTTLPANVVTTTGSQTLTNKIIGSSQLTAPTRHSIRPSLNLDFANSKVLDPRITFTRGSNATYYDGYTSVKAEENLVKYSQEFEDNSWIKSGVTISANSTTAPDGTTTADELIENTATASHRLYVLGVAVDTSKTYTQSVFVKANTRDAFIMRTSDGGNDGNAVKFDVGTQTTTNLGLGADSSSITDVGNGWYRCSMTFSPTATAFNLYIGLLDGSGNASYTGDGSSSLYIWGFQFEQRDSLTAYTPTTTSPITKYQPALQTAGNNVARFDHNPTTGESLGLLIEESRTNLIPYSEDLTQISWIKGQITITSNTIIAPDGTLTADKLVEDSTTNAHVISDLFTFTSGTTYTGTIYAKKAEKTSILFGAGNQGTWSARIEVNLSNGTITNNSHGSGTVTDVGNGWYRISLTGDALASATTGFNVWLLSSGLTSYTGDGYSGVYIWGAQLEEGSFPTSYIKTTGSQVTRSRDDCEMLNIDQDDWLKQGAGTLYGEVSKPYTGQDNGSNRYPRMFSLTNDQFDSNEISIYFTHATTPSIYGYISKDGVNYHANGLVSAPLTNTYYKASIAYERNNVDGSGNGSDETTDTSVEIPFINRLRIFKRVAGQNIFNFGYIKKLSYYPIKLTKNEIIDLTEE